MTGGPSRAQARVQLVTLLALTWLPGAAVTLAAWELAVPAAVMMGLTAAIAALVVDRDVRPPGEIGSGFRPRIADRWLRFYAAVLGLRPDRVVGLRWGGLAVCAVAAALGLARSALS